MNAYLSRPLPVITAGIEFSPRNIGPPPVITLQIDFANHVNDKNVPLPDDDIIEAEDIDMPGPEKTPDYNTDNIPDDTSELIVITKIPKPNGEPGRPRSGGYSLEMALGNWGEDLFQVVNKFIKKKVDEDLNTTQNYSRQNKAAIQKICTLAGDHFPILQKYENYWPARDMIKLHIKYTCESHRKERTAKQKV